MFVQTEVTPNPNSLKFLPGKKVSNSGPYEITNKEDMQNELVRNILSINGVEGIFLGLKKCPQHHLLTKYFSPIHFAYLLYL